MSQPKLIKFRGKGITAFKKPLSKAQQALNLARKNRAFIRATEDIHIHEVTLTAQAFNATPVVNFPVPGGGKGFKQMIKSIRLRGTINQLKASIIQDAVRVDIVMDTMPNKLEITPLLLYGDATPNTALFKDAGVQGRYKIFRTFRHTFNLTTTSEAESVDVDMYVKINRMMESSVDSGFANNQLIRNALYVIFWTSSSANQPVWGDCELRTVFVNEG